MKCLYGSGHCGPTVTTLVHHVVPHVSHSVPSGLPFTGGDVVGLALVGIGALASGFALVRAGRHSAA